MIILNPEHAKLLVGEPLDILPGLVKNITFNNWHDKAYYLQDTVSQEIIKSAYLILNDGLKKIENVPEKDPIADKYLDDLEVFYLALSDENVAKIVLPVTKVVAN
jgi:hypothetical protein